MYRYVEVLGESIAYEQKGKGKALLLLHGNRASSRAMEPLMEPLSDHMAVYAPDLSGFGRSSYRRRHEKARAFARDMAAFLSVFQLKDVVVLGWSFGGLVAMELAKICHEVRGMVLLSSVGPEGIRFPSVVAGTEKYRNMPKETARRERVKEMLADLLFDGDLPRAYFQLLEEAMLQRNSLDVLRAMGTYRLEDARDIPTLVLHGADDRVVAVDEGVKLSKCYRHSRLKIMAGGHFLIYNDCDAVVKEIEDFIADIKK